MDPAGAFHNGPAFRDYFELRDLIASSPERFAQGFTEALIEYGLGRPCGFSDQPLVEEVLARAGRQHFNLRTFLHALVASRQFQSK